MGRTALLEIASVARPDSILAWYRRLVAKKFDGSKRRQYPGRPVIQPEVEALVVRMAKENTGWGYDRIVGALANLGHAVSDQTVGNILPRHGIAPARKRSRTTSWKDFIAAHMNVLAGTGFFTVEVLTWRGLITYYILFFIHLESRRVSVAGIARHPDRSGWSRSRAAQPRKAGVISKDATSYCTTATRNSVPLFRSVLSSGGVKPITLPARSPNLNAFAERWVRSVKDECLSKLILFG